MRFQRGRRVLAGDGEAGADVRVTNRSPEDGAADGAATAENVRPLVGAREFETATGEPIERVLDLETWQPGDNLAALYAHLEEVVADAVGREDRLRAAIRHTVFPRLGAADRRGAPPNAGVFRATVADIERVHRGLLFTGVVEACDGTSVLHDSLPLSITQIGVCLVSYRGDQGSWVQRMYRRDLCVSGPDPVEEALDLLERRQGHGRTADESRRDTLSDLGRRAIMAYAERAVLLHRSTASWRMGHGNPLPYELLTGSGMIELLDHSLDLLGRLVAHGRFVYVPSAAARRELLTIGQALRPLEYAIVDTQAEYLAALLRRGSWGGPTIRRLREFAAEMGPKVVIGIYRAAEAAAAQVFYAHVEYAHEAALIAMADSALQEHRGFPMLIDLADMVCRATFDPASFNAATQLAYVDADAPFRYQSERQSRRG